MISYVVVFDTKFEEDSAIVVTTILTNVFEAKPTKNHQTQFCCTLARFSLLVRHIKPSWKCHIISHWLCKKIHLSNWQRNPIHAFAFVLGYHPCSYHVLCLTLIIMKLNGEPKVIKESHFYVNDDKEHDTLFVQHCLLLHWC